MPKKIILVALVAIFVLTSVVTSYALSYYRVRRWSNQYVQNHRFYCVTLPIYTSNQSHRLSLEPLNNDVDLYVYGYSGSWVLIGGSANDGMAFERVTFSRAKRIAYHTIIACGYGYGGSSYFNLNYYVSF